MKVKIKDDILKAVFNTLQNITEEGIISLEKDEIYICCMDEGRVCLIEFTIKKKNVSDQSCNIIQFFLVQFFSDFQCFCQQISHLYDLR